MKIIIKKEKKLGKKKINGTVHPPTRFGSRLALYYCYYYNYSNFFEKQKCNHRRPMGGGGWRPTVRTLRERGRGRLGCKTLAAGSDWSVPSKAASGPRPDRKTPVRRCHWSTTWRPEKKTSRRPISDRRRRWLDFFLNRQKKRFKLPLLLSKKQKKRSIQQHTCLPNFGFFFYTTEDFFLGRKEPKKEEKKSRSIKSARDAHYIGARC